MRDQEHKDRRSIPSAYVRSVLKKQKKIYKALINGQDAVNMVYSCIIDHNKFSVNIDLKSNNNQKTVKNVIKKTISMHFYSGHGPDYISKRLAGNYEKIQEGIFVPLYTGIPENELVISKIIGAQPKISAYKSIPGVVFYFEILSGAPAGEIIQSFFPEKMLLFMAKELKLRGRYSNDTPHYREFFGMQTLLDLTLDSDEKTKVHRFRSHKTLNNRNLKLKRSRNIDKRNCPYGKTALPCYMCAASLDKCPNATHTYCYIHKECTLCHKVNPCNENSPESPCLICEYAAWNSGKVFYIREET
jgi:hypothetical protein